MNQDSPPVRAVVYSDSGAAERLIEEVVRHLRSCGYRIGGLIQSSPHRSGRARCDMILEDLASGRRIAISEDRGALARGCRLDVGRLLDAMQLVLDGLGAIPELVVLNKFGKAEAEGGGMRTLLAELLERGLPVLIAVPRRNLDQWRAFAGEMSREVTLESLPADVGNACKALGLLSEAAAMGLTKPDTLPGVLET